VRRVDLLTDEGDELRSGHSFLTLPSLEAVENLF